MKKKILLGTSIVTNDKDINMLYRNLVNHNSSNRSMIISDILSGNYTLESKCDALTKHYNKIYEGNIKTYKYSNKGNVGYVLGNYVEYDTNLKTSISKNEEEAEDINTDEIAYYDYNKKIWSRELDVVGGLSDCYFYNYSKNYELKYLTDKCKDLYIEEAKLFIGWDLVELLTSDNSGSFMAELENILETTTAGNMIANLTVMSKYYNILSSYSKLSESISQNNTIDLNITAEINKGLVSLTDCNSLVYSSIKGIGKVVKNAADNSPVTYDINKITKDLLSLTDDNDIIRCINRYAGIKAYII